MSSRKKVLIVSLGSIGRRHLRNTRTLLPDAQIAVFRQYQQDSKEGPPEGADAIFYNLQDALAFAPEAVIVASPASEHMKNAEPFLNQGAHLFLEKPLATTSSEIGEFVQSAKQSSSFVMVGYVLRFLPLLNFIRTYLAENKIGKIRTARVQVGQYLPDWRPGSDYRQGVSAQRKLGGGALLELSHELDYAVWLFGKPDSLLCSRAHLSDLEIDVEDSAHVVLEYSSTPNPKRVLVQVDFLARVANMALEVVGSEATLKADLINETLILVSPAFPKGQAIEAPTLKEGNEIYLRQFDFFFAKSFKGYVPKFKETTTFDGFSNLAQASTILKLVDLAKQSDEQGRRLRVEEKI